MSSRLFVGNLPYDATEDELRSHFSVAGNVTSVFIPVDRETSRPRGFAFIEFEQDGQAAAAIQQLHQQPFKDRPLVVNEARPNEARGPGPARAPSFGPRPSGPRPSTPRASGPPSDVGEGGRERAPRRTGPRGRRRGRKGGGWEEGPRKEPIPEKRRSQIFGGYDEPEEGEEEEVDFENFATGLSETEDDES